MVDANILFKLGAPANVQTAMHNAANGLLKQNEIEQMPIRNQMLDEQAKAAGLQNQRIAREIKAEDADFVLRDVALDAMDVIPIIKRGNMAEFSAFMDGRIRKIEGRGGDATESRAFKEQMESGLMSPDVALERLQGAVEKARQAGVLEGASMAGNRSFAPVPMTDASGNFSGYAVPTVDSSGNATMRPIAGSERALSPIDLAREREQIGTEGYRDRRYIEADTAPTIATGTATGKGYGERIQTDINTGIDAADATANIRRGIELLELVKTGGFDAAALRAKQVLGIEAGDEGELSNTLGKTVLSQLRTTFGAAFTAKEGEQLAQIEAGLGKSPETNKRLLQRALQLAERSANRGLDAARKTNDTRAIQEIENALNFRFDFDAPDKIDVPPPPTGSATPQTMSQPIYEVDW